VLCTGFKWTFFNKVEKCSEFYLLEFKYTPTDCFFCDFAHWVTNNFHKPFVGTNLEQYRCYHEEFSSSSIYQDQEVKMFAYPHCKHEKDKKNFSPNSKDEF